MISTSREPQRPSVAWNMSAGARRSRPDCPTRSAGRGSCRRLVAAASTAFAVVAASSCSSLLLDLGEVGADDALRIAVRRASRPSSSQSASSQNRSTRPSECVTSRIVLPRRLNSRELVEALVREALVADRQHFVDEQHVGIDVDRDGEPEAHVHAGRVGLHRRVDEVAQLGELDDLVEALAGSRACVRPSMMPLMKTFSRPEISGWKPAPSSISAEMRPSHRDACRSSAW